MYEQLKNDFTMQLTTLLPNLGNNEINDILCALDMSANKYDITKKETGIVIYNQGIPYYVKTFLVCKSVEGYSHQTLYNYKLYLCNFFYAIQKAPEQVTSNDVRVYLYQYQETRKVSNQTLEKIRDCFSSFYKWMCVEGYMTNNPMIAVKRIKCEKKTRTSCTQLDLEILRWHCKTLKERAVLEFLYSTGCRVGELVNVKISDINWYDKSVHLFGKGKKHRISYLNAKTELALKQYLESRTDSNEYLFVSDRRPHNQLHTDGIQKILRNLSKRSKLDSEKHITPHVLRHTTATRMIQNNASLTSIQKILGHSNIATTMIYTHTSMEDVKADHLKAIV